MYSLIIFLAFATESMSQGNCTFYTNALHAPMVVNSSFQFFETDIAEFQLFEPFYIQCMEGTSSPFIAENGDSVACKGDESILNIRTNEIINFTNIECKTKQSITVQKRDELCYENGTKFDIGYNIYNHLVPVVNVCFDEVNQIPIYAKSNRYLVEEDSSFWDTCYNDIGKCSFTNVANLNKIEDITKMYAYSNQQKMLDNLNVSITIDDEVHLVPSSLLGLNIFGDNVLTKLLLDYTNLAPFWSNLFYTVADVLSAVNEPIVVTGTLGVGTLLDKDGKEVELSLNNGSNVVPAWFWFSFGPDSPIITLYNDPFESSNADLWQSEICSNTNIWNVALQSCPYNDIINPSLINMINDAYNNL